jgi:Glycosyltransferase family 87
LGSLSYHGGPVGNDFLAFYSAAVLAWDHSAAEIYDLARLYAFQDALSGTATHLPFPYPPQFLLYLAPLTTIAYLPALYLWIVATSAPFVLIVRKLSGLALPLVALAPPLIQNAIDGQNGALTASLFAGGLLLLANRRPALAGILFGLLSYKPQVFLLIPLCLLAARQYRALGALIVTGIVLLTASLAIFGAETWWKFLEVLPQQTSYLLAGRLPIARCPTVFAAIFEASGDVFWAKAAQGLSTLAAWTLVFWSWRKSDAFFPRAVAFCVALPLSTPYLLEYDLAIWALPASILLGRLWRGEGARPDWAALALFWLSPPLIWLSSLTPWRVSVLPVLALAPYAIWCVRRERLSGLPAVRSRPDDAGGDRVRVAPNDARFQSI